MRPIIHSQPKIVLAITMCVAGHVIIINYAELYLIIIA